jgi:hypothetical protein
MSPRVNHAVHKFDKYVFNHMTINLSGGRFTPWSLPETYSRTFRRFKVEKNLRGKVRTEYEEDELQD